MNHRNRTVKYGQLSLLTFRCQMAFCICRGRPCGAIVDWYSRFILSWELSDTLTTDFCLKVLNDALKNGQKPEIFNTDQGSQFTSKDFTEVLIKKEILVSMDGKGRALDNIFIERFWRTINRVAGAIRIHLSA